MYRYVDVYVDTCIHKCICVYDIYMGINVYIYTYIHI